MCDTNDAGDEEEENIHYHPIEVTEASGPDYAVCVKETYSDGSHSTEFYTEEQARELFFGLADVLGPDGI